MPNGTPTPPREARLQELNQAGPWSSVLLKSPQQLSHFPSDQSWARPGGDHSWCRGSLYLERLGPKSLEQVGYYG